MSKEVTKSYSFLGKHKGGSWSYVSIDPFDVRFECDFAKVKATPDGLAAEVDKLAQKSIEACEDKCHKGIISLEKKIEGVLQHALLAAQISGDKGPIKRAAKEAEALIKKANEAIKKETDALTAEVDAQAKKGLAKKYAEAFKSFKVTSKGAGGTPLNFLFVEPKIKVSDDKLPAAQGLRKGTLDLGKTVASLEKTDSTLSAELEKAVAAHTAALWKDKDFGKSGDLNHDRALWSSHSKTGEAAAGKLDAYSDFIDKLYESVEARQNVLEARAKKLKKEIGDMKDKGKADKAKSLAADVEATNKKMWVALKELSGYADTKKAYLAALAPLLTQKSVSTAKGAFEKTWHDARGGKTMDGPKRHLLATAKHLKGVADELEKVMS